MRSGFKQRTRSSSKSELTKSGAQLKLCTAKRQEAEAWLPPGSVKSGLHGDDDGLC